MVNPEDKNNCSSEQRYIINTLKNAEKQGVHLFTESLICIFVTHISTLMQALQIVSNLMKSKHLLLMYLNMDIFSVYSIFA